MESGQTNAPGTTGKDAVVDTQATGAVAGGGAQTGGAAGADAIVVGVDVTGDGVPDIIGIDADADGTLDAVIVDDAAAGMGAGAGQMDLGADDDLDTGASDPVYDLVSVLYHALQGAETTMIYSDDADLEGDDELAQFFQEVQAQDRARARRAKALLRKYLAEES